MLADATNQAKLDAAQKDLDCLVNYPESGWEFRLAEFLGPISRRYGVDKNELYQSWARCQRGSIKIDLRTGREYL